MTAVSTEELIELLDAGARQHGTDDRLAAMHLLVFTAVPSLPAFRRFVRFREIDLSAGERRMIAQIINWDALAKTTGIVAPLGGGDRHLLDLAIDLAGGGAASLTRSLDGLGHAHARRVAEAVLIAAGYGAFYDLTPTPKLADLLALHGELQQP
jgi:hypothetical protein